MRFPPGMYQKLCRFLINTTLRINFLWNLIQHSRNIVYGKAFANSCLPYVKMLHFIQNKYQQLLQYITFITYETLQILIYITTPPRNTVFSYTWNTVWLQEYLYILTFAQRIYSSFPEIEPHEESWIQQIPPEVHPMLQSSPRAPLYRNCWCSVFKLFWLTPLYRSQL